MVIVLVAIVGVFGSVVGPALLAYLNGRQRRAEKREDYARQDQVADRVTEAADRTKAVAEQAAEAARLLVASNAVAAKTAAHTAAITNGKLDQIHTLVNSTLTEAIEAQLEATLEQLAMMRRALAGETVPPSLESMAALEAKIADTRASLTERIAQAAVGRKQTEGT